MVNVSVARRYARALIEVASETGSVDPLLEQLDAVAQAVDSSPELRDLMVNPSYARTQRLAVVNQILDALGKPSPALKNLLHLLVDRDRLVHLPGIARIYRDYADERAGRVRGKVASAVPLATDAMQRLERALEKITQRKVVLETRVDPHLLGGVSAQVGSVTYDGSLRSQLEELRRQLKAGR